MPSFNELVNKYKKRRHDTVMDAVTTGLSMAKNVSVDLGLLEDTGYVSSNLNPFESQYAPFGLSNARYKYQWVYEKQMNTEEYNAALAEWEAERARRIEYAEANNIDY